MDRQTLRDWVIRFNEEGPEGLINKPSPDHKGVARILSAINPSYAVGGQLRLTKSFSNFSNDGARINVSSIQRRRRAQLDARRKDYPSKSHPAECRGKEFMVLQTETGHNVAIRQTKLRYSLAST
jgi:hypothetical protein